MSKVPRYNICKECGASFKMADSDSSYCSRACVWKKNSKEQRVRQIVKCSYCTKDISLTPSALKERNYCSKPCYYRWRSENWKLPEEHYARIGNLLKGKPRPVEVRDKISKANKGQTSYRKGLTFAPHSLEIRQKISESRKGKCKGENNPAWKDGNAVGRYYIRKGVALRDWRKQVFIRDEYTCQICNEKGGKLNAHHIQNFSDFSDLRTEVSNGITLCKKCHDTFHGSFGRVNNNLEQINQFKKLYV